MSNRSDAVRMALKKGYRVLDDGSVVNAVGRPRKLSAGRPYASFTVSLGHLGIYPVAVHRLLAFQLFGEAAMEPGIHTRHLDGDPLNNTFANIAIGSASDNSMDRPKSDRVEHALRASSSNIRDDWSEICQDYQKGMGFRKLSAKYGVSTGALSFHFNKIEGWKPIQQYSFEWDVIRDYILKNGCSYVEAAKIFHTTSRSIARRLGGQKALAA